MKEKDKALLEIAIDLLRGKKTPQSIKTITQEVMELKGLKGAAAEAAAPQFILDFMQSGYFVYCGVEGWDLKDRQPTSILDKDGYDGSTNSSEEDEEIKKNELNDDLIYQAINPDSDDDDGDDNDDNDDNDDEQDGYEDLSSDFDDFDASEVRTDFDIELSETLEEDEEKDE